MMWSNTPLGPIDVTLVKYQSQDEYGIVITKRKKKAAEDIDATYDETRF